MLVANSFDLWQKDIFFSAAEEVQQSADIMESSYRTWLRARREGWKQEDLDNLSRELQMALGTAKWQLEEFERAVRMSYRSHQDDITVSRHSQFVSALEDQISRVETALKESFQVDGKKAFHWVNLDEEECDDLALFLSGSSGTSQRIADEEVGTSLRNKKNSRKEDSNLGTEVSSTIQSSDEGMSPQKVVATDEEDSKFLESGSSISYQADRIASNRRTWSPPHISALEIVIDKDDRQKNAEIEATPKEKGTKPFFWNLRGEDRAGVKGGVSSPPQLNMINWIIQMQVTLLLALERMSEKSETTTDVASVACQFLTLCACFTANHFFSGAFFGVFDLSHVELPRSRITKEFAVMMVDGELFEMVLFLSFDF